MANYVTTFEIRDREGKRAASELLEEVKALVQRELEGSREDRKDWEVESGVTDEAAYAEVSATRRHPSEDGHPIRLEVRLCTGDGQLYAEVRSWFMLMSKDRLPNVPSGPPRLLQALAEEFRCVMRGESELCYEPYAVTESNAEEYINDVIASEDRKLPIMAISLDAGGEFGLDPMDAQRMLAGIATVVTYDLGAVRVLKTKLSSGVLCYGGSIRILWPGSNAEVNDSGPRIYKSRYDLLRSKRTVLVDIQQKCIEQAPDSNFDRWFYEAKALVASEQVRQMKVQGPVFSTRDERKTNLTITQLQGKNKKQNEKIEQQNRTIADLRAQCFRRNPTVHG